MTAHMRTILLTLILGLAVQTCIAQQAVSRISTFHVKESNAHWEALVNDSLEHCVINAGNIAVMNATFPKEKNITKQVSFKLANAEGAGRTVNGRVAAVVDFGGQAHYTAELTIGLNLGDRWEYRTVQCILADLSAYDQQLIIGSNWLGDDFIVGE